MFTRRTREANISSDRSVEAVELAVLLTEALHDAHAGDVFLDDVGDVACLLLRVPTRGEHRRAQLHRGDEEQRRDREHDQREQRREPEHGAERHDEQQDVRDADREELQEALHERDVGRRAAHELPGRQLVVTREVEALQLGEDRGAEVVLHVERDAPATEPAEVGEDERRHAHEDHQDQPGREGLTVALTVLRLGRDHVVDHDALHQRQQRLDELAADRHPERDVRVLLVRLHVSDEPPDPTLFFGRYGFRPSVAVRRCFTVRASGLRSSARLAVGVVVTCAPRAGGGLACAPRVRRRGRTAQRRVPPGRGRARAPGRGARPSRAPPRATRRRPPG